MYSATRSYISLTHLLSADYFAYQCDLLESQLARPEWRVIGIEFTNKDYIAHRAFVTGTVFSCIAFLEATINEIFQDSYDDLNGYIVNFSLVVRNQMNDYWNEKKYTAKTLDKYQTLLSILNHDQFDKGTNPYQTVYYLIEFRNYLTHYKPEWFAINEVHRFEKFFSGKFDFSILALERDPIFPDKIFGAGFATWAVKMCLIFTDEFYKKIGIIEPVYKDKTIKLNCV